MSIDAVDTAGAPPDRQQVFNTVRRSVRSLLEQAPAFREASPQNRRALAEGMVTVSMMAADLLAEDRRVSAELARRAQSRGQAAPLAVAQSAGDQLGMQAVRSAAGVMSSLKDSIDFPTFVTSLITGVFQAILTSSTHQVGSLGELLDNVSATADEFESTVDDTEVARWMVAKFNALLTMDDGGSLAVRPGVDLMDHLQELRAGLSANDGEVGGIDPEDLEGTLLPLGRRKMGRDKQSVLASMVQMGLQRIVVDEGRLHASMDLRVDAASLSQQDVAQRDDWRVKAGAAGSFGTGPWSASASASTSIGKVKADHEYTDEQVAVRAGLRSSVDLAFRTEQVPLDRLADANARVRIDKNARVPTDVSGGQSILPTGPAVFTPPSFGDIPPPPDMGQPATPAQRPAASASPRPPGTPATASPGARTPVPAPAGGGTTPAPATPQRTPAPAAGTTQPTSNATQPAPRQAAPAPATTTAPARAQPAPAPSAPQSASAPASQTSTAPATETAPGSAEAAP